MRRIFCSNSVEYLAPFFKEIDVHSLPKQESFLISRKHNSSDVYGTTDPKILRYIAKTCNIGPSDVFVDLGSGFGW